MPENNLPELRDIHLPQGVDFFPIAYGWWVILAGILGLVALFFLIRFLRKKSKKLYALYLLKNITPTNPVIAAAQISVILRRICVFKYKEAATLAGNDWLQFLNAKTQKPLAGKAAELLLEAPYIPQNSKAFARADALNLQNFCKRWIGENL